jgi:hypothetical protein
MNRTPRKVGLHAGQLDRSRVEVNMPPFNRDRLGRSGAGVGHEDHERVPSTALPGDRIYLGEGQRSNVLASGRLGRRHQLRGVSIYELRVNPRL